MIRTFNLAPAGVLRSHYMYQFVHQDMLCKAYDEIGKGLCQLRTEILVKYEAMQKDQSRYVYYRELIQNLEKQFSRMVIEGLHNGSVEIIKAAAVQVEERKVA